MTEREANDEQIADIQQVKYLYTKFKTPEAKTALYKLWWLLVYARQSSRTHDT